MTSSKPDLSALRINREQEGTETGKRTSRRWIVAAIVVVLAVAGIIALRSAFTTVPEVQTATAIMSSAAQSQAVLTASGYVVAQRKAAVASKGTGRLEYLGVEEGDRVKKGEVIARLEDEDVVAALAKARADLAMARADSAEAALSFMRQQKLDSLDLTSQAELDVARARYHRVAATIRSAMADVEAAQVSVENTRIRAPFSGTVLTKDADVGEVVAPFAASSSSRGAVVTMADMSSLEVEADVSESNITRVNVGQPCEITLDAYPDHRYEGYVHKIVPTADRAKATVLTKVRFRKLDERVLPEMSAKVLFLSKDVDSALVGTQPTLTIPANAILTKDGQQVVFIVGNSHLSERPVSTGNRIGDRIVITGGLEAGEQVVQNPNPELRSGEEVKIKS